MHLFVDGVIYGRQKHGGINTLFNNVLPRLAARESMEVDVFLPRTCRGETPSAPVRRLRRNFLQEKTGLSPQFDQIVVPLIQTVNSRIRALRVYGRPRIVFQSTYFTFLPAAVPHVAIALDMNHELFPEGYQDEFGVWLRKVYPEYLRQAHRIVAISQSTKDDVGRLYGIDEAVIDVVHLAVDPLTYFRDRDERHLRFLHEHLGIKPPYLLCVGGRSAAYKNFARLLEVFAPLALSRGLTLVVAGPRWLDIEVSQIDILGLAGFVRLIEHPTNDVLRVLYNFAHAFVFPSLNEGFGMPLLEAMACGTPVVAASTRVFREVAGDAAIFFEPNDPGDLGRAIELCLDEDVREEFGARGLRQVTRYSWDRCADAMYAVYRKALDSF